MQIIEVPVKREGEVVATVSVEQYESIAEAIDRLGEDKVLADLNRQVKTDAANRARVAAAEQSVESQMARIVRASKKGAIAKGDAKAQLAALLAQLGED